MKIYIIMLLGVFLTACNEYTVTNKTDKDVRLVKSGGESVTIPAQSCIVLVEFMVQMGGDFPFSIKDCDSCKEEYKSSHYEISSKVDSSDTEELTTEVNSSDKNSDCNGTKEEQEEEDDDKNGETQSTENDNIKAKPACENEDFQLVCQDEHDQTVSMQARCSDSNGSLTVICVGSKGFPVSGINPACIKKGEANQEPVCQDESTDGS